MSQENPEVVQAMIEGFNRDGALPEELFDPQVDLFNIRESPLPGPYHGYDGLRKWRDGVFEVIEDGRFEISELRNLDEADIVIYRVRLLGRARHTGLEIDIEWSNVNWLRDGRIYRSESFTNHSDALKAAGLSE
jgi:ketosteroid isomerase-like protein